MTDTATATLPPLPEGAPDTPRARKVWRALVEPTEDHPNGRDLDELEEFMGMRQAINPARELNIVLNRMREREDLFPALSWSFVCEPEPAGVEFVEIGAFHEETGVYLMRSHDVDDLTADREATGPLAALAYGMEAAKEWAYAYAGTEHLNGTFFYTEEGEDDEVSLGVDEEASIFFYAAEGEDDE